MMIVNSRENVKTEYDILPRFASISLSFIDVYLTVAYFATVISFYLQVL